MFLPNYIMRILPVIILAVITNTAAIHVVTAQTLNVDNYRYSMITAGQSRETALDNTIQEALLMCVESNLGFQIASLTNLYYFESRDELENQFNNFISIVSNGYIKSFNVVDTLQRLLKYPFLETTVVLDVVLEAPEDQNIHGLSASTNAYDFESGAQTNIIYSVAVNSYVYIFAYTDDGRVYLYNDPENKTRRNRQMSFPGSDLRLTMQKETHNAIEFGCFVVIASDRPLPLQFTRAPKDSGYGLEMIVDTKPFSQILGRNDVSIVYIPYSIM